MPFDHSLPDDFAQFFIDKIVKINATITNELTNEAVRELSEFSKPGADSLTAFRPATELEIAKIISQSSAATSKLDPIPTDLLKQCKDQLVPVITSIVNSSLISGSFPETMKHAVIKPF